MKYGNLTLGQIEALVNNLGGREVVDQLLRFKGLKKQIKHLLSPTITTITLTDAGTELPPMLGFSEWFGVDCQQEQWDKFQAELLALTGGTSFIRHLALFGFPYMLKETELRNIMIEHGYKPATLRDLALLSCHPDVQSERKQTGIICLGKLLYGNQGNIYKPYLPFLQESHTLDEARRISLLPYDANSFYGGGSLYAAVKVE